MVEVDARDLYRAEGCSSLFKYCTEILGYSEDAAFMRVQAASVLRAHPEILADLARGALHLSGIRLLAPHLSLENGRELLDAARHKSKREVEKLVRSRFPLPDVPATVRKLPAPTTSPASVPASVLARVSAPALAAASAAASTSASTSDGLVASLPVGAARASFTAPLAAERYKVQFTITADLHDRLRYAQNLLRHQVPSGDLSRVFELALNALVEQLEKRKFAATERPRVDGASGAVAVARGAVARGAVARTAVRRGAAPNTRLIPADVRRAVWRRDGGRCAFVGRGERRCSETGFLEFHHVVPFARGGPATVANIALRCRAHNQFEAELEFGPLDACTLGGIERPLAPKPSLFGRG